MSQTAYYLAWLAAGLVASAIASALIARHLRLRVVRRAKAIELVDALARYTAWIAVQQHITLFRGEEQEGASALAEVRGVQREWFPDLAPEAAQLLEVHARLIDFLWTEQTLRLKDPEAWLESDHDARFQELWQMHREAVQAAGVKLQWVAEAADRGAKPRAETTFPA